MTSLKKHQIIMLPTSRKNNNILWKLTKPKINILPKGNINKLDILHFGNENIKGAWKDGNIKCQHLYILSNESIKEGDWYIDDANNVRLSVTSDEDYWSKRPEYKKVISITDTSLNLPQPSQAFIQKYVERYNADDPITYVMVEYQYPEMIKISSHLLLTGSDEEKQEMEAQLNLKVNPKDNIITIRSVKDTWNKEEVIKILKDSFISSIESEEKCDLTWTLDKWIDENL